MNNFVFWAPTRFYFGKGEENNTGKYLKEFGAKKILLCHYGTNLDFENSLVDRVVKSLTEAGLEYIDFQGIKPNPAWEKAEEGRKIAEKENIDFILAVGGGSVIDTAKYIGLSANYDGDAYEDFYLKGKKVEKTLPVGSITTLAGTGSEGSFSSVITKGELKRSCNQDIIRPAIAIMNPELTYTLPAFQTAAGGADIMAHVHERYFCADRDTYLTDGICEAIFRTIIKYLPIAVKDPTNYEARAAIMWASIIAHNESVGVGRSGDRYGLAHAIQSEIGGKYDSNHGAGCACATIGMMKYLYKRDIPRFERYFNQVWGIPIDTMDPENMIERGIEMQRNFYLSIGIPMDVHKYGVKDEDIPSLASTVRRNPEGFIGGSMKLKDEDIIEIYKLMV